MLEIELYPLFTPGHFIDNLSKKKNFYSISFYGQHFKRYRTIYFKLKLNLLMIIRFQHIHQLIIRLRSVNNSNSLSILNETTSMI